MNRINEFNLEPGLYTDDEGFKLVLLDIIDHAWSHDKQLVEYLSSPLAMGRELLGGEKRFVWPIEVFKIKFRKI